MSSRNVAASASNLKSTQHALTAESKTSLFLSTFFGELIWRLEDANRRHQSIVDEMVNDLFKKMAEGKVPWKAFWSIWICFICCKHHPLHHPRHVGFQASCLAISELVQRICRMNHSLVPKLGWWFRWSYKVWFSRATCESMIINKKVTDRNRSHDPFSMYQSIYPWSYPFIALSNNHIMLTGNVFLSKYPSIWVQMFVHPLLNPLRKPILELHTAFLCGGGWGLERTLNRWVLQQPWRKPMPLDFFKPLSDMCVLTSEWKIGNWHTEK